MRNKSCCKINDCAFTLNLAPPKLPLKWECVGWTCSGVFGRTSGWSRIFSFPGAWRRRPAARALIRNPRCLPAPGVGNQSHNSRNTADFRDWDWNLGFILRIWDSGLGFGINFQNLGFSFGSLSVTTTSADWHFADRFQTSKSKIRSFFFIKFWSLRCFS